MLSYNQGFFEIASLRPSIALRASLAMTKWRCPFGTSIRLSANKLRAGVSVFVTLRRDKPVLVTLRRDKPVFVTLRRDKPSPS